MISDLGKYAKAIVVLVVMGAMLLFDQLGVVVDEGEFTKAVTITVQGLVTLVAVFGVKNRAT